MRNMSNIINFNLKELRKLVSDKNSCVVVKTVAQNLALQPWCLGNIEESIKTLLDYKIWKYVKEFEGILLSYKNLCILQNVGTISNDNAIYYPVQAEYFIFKPYIGATLKGIVNKKSDTHLGLLVHRVFNVVIPRPTDKPGNTWIGTSVQENQEVMFKVVVLDLYGALPYIRGELDESLMKLENGEDENYELSCNKSIDVSFVDFDKIRPSQKQLDKSTSNSINKSSIESSGNHDDSSRNNERPASENKVISYDKRKVKRHKSSDSDCSKNNDTNAKTHKKQKKMS